MDESCVKELNPILTHERFTRVTISEIRKQDRFLLVSADLVA